MTRILQCSKSLLSALLLVVCVIALARPALAAPQVLAQIDNVSAYRAALVENLSALVTLNGSGFAPNKLLVVDLTSSDFANEAVLVPEGGITEEQTILTDASGNFTLTFEPAFVGLLEPINTQNTWGSEWLILSDGLQANSGLKTIVYYSH